MFNNNSIPYIIEELKALTNITKPDYLSKEHSDIENELIEIVKKDSLIESLLKNKEIRLIGRIDSIIHRGWLFEYKDRGFILKDLGNTHWIYMCSAEELVLDIYMKVTHRKYVE